METCKIWMRARHRKHIAENTELPLLVTYSSDCTPLRTRGVQQTAMGQHRIVYKPRMPGEWLTQRCFVRDSKHYLTCFFDEPA